MTRLFAAALLASTLAACATVPAPLQGPYVDGSPTAGYAEGEPVRWGGSIISVEPRPDTTCFQVLARELNDYSRPRRIDDSAGRFLACRKGFYDPAVFTEGRDVTVAGRIDGRETRRIGEYDYPLPRVAADVVYLWPERTIYDDPYYWHRPYWGPWYGPAWAHPHPWGWRW